MKCLLICFSQLFISILAIHFVFILFAFSFLANEKFRWTTNGNRKRARIKQKSRRIAQIPQIANAHGSPNNPGPLSCRHRNWIRCHSFEWGGAMCLGEGGVDTNVNNSSQKLTTQVLRLTHCSFVRLIGHCLLFSPSSSFQFLKNFSENCLSCVPLSNWLNSPQGTEKN